MINFNNSLLKHYMFERMYIRLFNRMKHSNVIYDLNTKNSLVDNSLIKDLEIAKERKLRIKKIRENKKEIEETKETKFEMSESHGAKPYTKNPIKF